MSKQIQGLSPPVDTSAAFTSCFTDHLSSDSTVDGITYKKSSASIEKLTLTDKGTYVCTVSITNLEGEVMLSKTFTTVLSILSMELNRKFC